MPKILSDLIFYISTAWWRKREQQNVMYIRWDKNCSAVIDNCNVLLFYFVVWINLVGNDQNFSIITDQRMFYV